LLYTHVYINITAASVYGIYISQLICCGSYQDVIDRMFLL